MDIIYDNFIKGRQAMKRPMETYRGDYFFRQGAMVFVNRSSESFSVSYHNHDFLELAYIAEGEGFHHIEDQVQKVRKGQLFFIPLGVPHVFRPTSAHGKPLIVNNCIFSVLLLPKLIAFASDPGMVTFLKQMEEGLLGHISVTDRNDRFEQLFETLYEQNARSMSGSNDYLHALLLQLIIELKRARDELEPTGPMQANDHSFQEVLQYVENHYMKELTLTHLAHASGFSERHLQRLFLQYTGMTWHHYLQTVRIRMSRRLLRSTSSKISAVAEQVGYKDIHSFNRVFKRSMGLTPGQYRKEARLSMETRVLIDSF